MARPVNSLSYLFPGSDIEWFFSKALKMAARLDDREEKKTRDINLGQLTCLQQGFSHNPDEDCAHFTFEQSMYHLTLYQSGDLFHSILSVLVSIGELEFSIKKIEENGLCEL